MISQYRGAISYPNSGGVDISKYLPSPTDIDPLNIVNDKGQSANQGGNYTYISRQYFNSCYGGNNMESTWPYQDSCLQDITIGDDLPAGGFDGYTGQNIPDSIDGYTYGNSARNVNMFIWRSAKSYDVCND
jgi:hypothetical protein